MKWAGGKRWQVPRLEPLWRAHVHRRLVEPFCGGLAVTLGLRPQRALLNDINPHLINFYEWLKRGLRVDIALDERRARRSMRTATRFNALLRGRADGPREAAGLFYYLNRTGYNGLCRFNKRGEFNVPFGKYKRVGTCSDFAEYRDVLSAWTFTRRRLRAAAARRPTTSSTPIRHSTSSSASTRKEGFDWDDQVRTATWLAAHRGPVVLVNQATSRIRRLYRDLGFRLEYVSAPRRINSTGDRTPAREVIATRNI